MENGTGIMEYNSVISYNTKHTPTTWSAKPAHWFLPKGIGNYVHLKNLHTDVYGGFTHSFQNLEPTKIPLEG